MLFKRKDVIRRWRIVRILPESAACEFYEVREIRAPRRKGVLKILIATGDLTVAEAFRGEADLVAEQPLPGRMIECLDRGVWKGHDYFVSALGKELPDKLPRRELARCARQIAETLGDFHRAGWVHNDVKPWNILIYGDRYVLSDFGSARRIESVPDNPTREGTPAFMAPEVDRRGQLSRYSDVLSLGKTVKALRKDEDVRYFAPLVGKATSDDPTDRFDTMDDFRQGLDALPDSYVEEVSKASRMRKFVTIIVSSLVLAAITLGLGSLLWNEFDKRVERRWGDRIDRKTTEKLARKVQSVNGITNICIHMELENQPGSNIKRISP